MKKINIENIEYELIKDENDCFDLDVFKEKWTEDFKDFDYIVGDFSYDKVRLKGFYNSKNNKVKDHNNYNNLKNYLNENCAYGCNYFILKR